MNYKPKQYAVNHTYWLYLKHSLKSLVGFTYENFIDSVKFKELFKSCSDLSTTTEETKKRKGAANNVMKKSVKELCLECKTL